MKTKMLIVVIALMMGTLAEAQVVTPAASPAGSVSTTVGLTDVEVNYSRPKMKGRKIFGDGAEFLVPYGALWRTGANNGTTISFSDDVKVQGIDVPKGEYLIFSWPGANEWTISLYKDLKLGGNTNSYDKAQEVANFKAKPSKLAEKVETFTINIGDISDDSKNAKVELAWENTSVKFNVAVDYDAKVMKSIDANTKVNPGNYYQAAVYYLENGKDLKKALEWITIAADANPKAFWVMYQKAKIQKALGDTKGAKESATASLKGASEAKNRDYQNMNEALLKELK